MLNTEQELGYNIMMAGYNTFLSGGAGVGKTYTLNKFITDSINKGKNVMVTAPTGIAALNINGVTIHRQFEAPLGVLTYNKNTYEPSDELVHTDIVVIEEISMCRIDLFDFVCNKILDANSRRKRLGLKVIQLILSGDFFQLPPVILETDKRALNNYYGYDVGAGFAFYSKFWKMFNFKTIILNNIVRQSDKNFIFNLNKIRTGEKAYIQYIYDNSAKDNIEGAVTICGTNSEANQINEYELSKVDTVYIDYYASTVGEVDQSDVSVDFDLKLKEGARVMTLVNKNSYNNGSFGTIVALYDDSIIVQMDNGSTETIDRYTWDIYRYELEDVDNKPKLIKKLAGQITQFPLKLAYAITIHKSQGQTYDAANISPYAWDCGQLYVAISRVRSLDKLHFNYAPDMRYLVISLNVIKFYNSLILGTNEDIKSAKENECENTANSDLDNDFNKLLQGFSNIKF